VQRVEQLSVLIEDGRQTLGLDLSHMGRGGVNSHTPTVVRSGSGLDSIAGLRPSASGRKVQPWLVAIENYALTASLSSEG